VSAMPRLIGVNCELCRQKGHVCRAQIFGSIKVLRSGEEWEREAPLCMPCADGEICYWQRAKLGELPPVADEIDLCRIPKVTTADWDLLRKIASRDGQATIDPALRARAHKDCEEMPLDEVSEKYQVSMRTAQGWKSAQLRARARFQKRAATPVASEHHGETVVMAPMAVMGAELLGTGGAPGKKKKLQVRKAPCLKCGLSFPLDRMAQHRKYCGMVFAQAKD
jgi:hypothetical protein